MAKNVAEASEARDELHVYEAGRAGLPRIGPYVRDLVARWPFAAEFSRSSIRSAHTDTVFGRLWLVINPTLLAVVYFILVVILTGRPLNQGGPVLVQICCGLFLYASLFQSAVSTGAGSVTGGGALISRMAFPRLLMPFAAVRTSFFRFLPTVPVFLVIKLVLGDRSLQPWGWEMALSVYFLATMVVFSAGIAALMGALQVYFRDTSSFLPYFLRIWMYLSPVLWPLSKVGPDSKFYPLMWANPMYPICGGWGETLIRATAPPPAFWVASLAWALVSLLAGSLFFMSKERDFSVRI
ncbi:MAG: ABC transporter permease [Bifidobacteriaceae bacterium]|nr:ABC transporter permease [Bifidobacteriaceae bacterium]